MLLQFKNLKPVMLKLQLLAAVNPVPKSFE
jgi:hypothetical protein